MPLMENITLDYDIDEDLYTVQMEKVYDGEVFYKYMKLLPKDLADMDAKTLLWFIASFWKEASKLIQEEVDQYKKAHHDHYKQNTL